MKKVLILFVAIITLTMTGCSKNKQLIEISYDELANKIENKESFVLYVGRATCSHCNDFKPVLEEVIDENKLEVYYIDLDTVSKAKYNAVMKKVDGEGTPTTVYIEKGKTKSSPRIEGAKDKEVILDFFRDLDLVEGE